jgi:hypothetical protein
MAQGHTRQPPATFNKMPANYIKIKKISLPRNSNQHVRTIFHYFHPPNGGHMKGNFYLFFITILIIGTVSCKQDKGLFRLISPADSGIDFNNKIVETDSMNPIDVTNIYNGGGVGVGDFNNDGLQDLYFTGSMVANKLYLNKGKFQFEDITSSAGVSGDGRWCRGVAVVDINNDGWMDIYVCVSMTNAAEKRKNLLYINQGVDKNRQPSFKESAAVYGLDDTTFTTMASFFDYDNDGDLDV